MKRTASKRKRPGAVEVASSTNGQLTPPVMGAAAFLISEFTGVAYPVLIKHALLPALISYIALVYIVHLEALKLGLKGLQKPPATMTLARKLSGVLLGFLLMAVLASAVYYGLGWVKVVFPDMTFATASLLFLLAYLVLLIVAARIGPGNGRSQCTDGRAAPGLGRRGNRLLLSSADRHSDLVHPDRTAVANLSAYWATVAMILIVLTQRPLKTFFRKGGNLAADFRMGGVISSMA